MGIAISQVLASLEPCFYARSIVRMAIKGDFITKVKQVNGQSDLISMSIFAGPSYLTIRSSVCIILI